MNKEHGYITCESSTEYNATVNRLKSKGYKVKDYTDDNTKYCVLYVKPYNSKYVVMTNIKKNVSGIFEQRPVMGNLNGLQKFIPLDKTIEDGWINSWSVAGNYTNVHDITITERQRYKKLIEQYEHNRYEQEFKYQAGQRYDETHYMDDVSYG